MSTAIETPSDNRIFWGTILSLSQRELIRFFRQRTRLIGALGQPFLFWILFGTGLHGSFKPPAWASADLTYQQYFFPGVTILILLFTAIYTTISIIEDRKEGFLQAVLVAPVSRLAIVLGKLFGGSILAISQVALFLILAPILSSLGIVENVWVDPDFFRVLGAIVFICLVAFALTALGYLIAWPMDSTQGFHAIMSIFLLPMWLLSGAFFPAPTDGSATLLSWIMWLNPLSYGVAGLQQLMLPPSEISAANSSLPSITVCFAVTIGFAIVCLAGDILLTMRTSSKDAR